MNISAVLRDIGLPYIWGYKPNSSIQGALRAEVERFLVRDPDIARLLEGAGLGDIPGHPDDSARADAERLLEALGAGSAVVDVEANRTESTQYERMAATIVIRRAEARLVARYRQTFAEDQVKRLRLTSRWTDLYVLDDGDLIEVKSGATHQYVRDALGQLLDYAAHATQRVSGTLAFARPLPPYGVWGASLG